MIDATALLQPHGSHHNSAVKVVPTFRCAKNRTWNLFSVFSGSTLRLHRAPSRQRRLSEILNEKMTIHVSIYRTDAMKVLPRLIPGQLRLPDAEAMLEATT